MVSSLSSVLSKAEKIHKEHKDTHSITEGEARGDPNTGDLVSESLKMEVF